MTPSDRAYLAWLLKDGLLKGPVLEIGSRSIDGQGGNTEVACRAAGLGWEGVDLAPGPGVNGLLDMANKEAVAAVEQRWSTVLLFNTLEHVYGPLTVLRNAISLTEIGGHCAVIAPTVWQLHDFPADYWRPLPDFYLEFARRESCTVIPSAFSWLVGDRLVAVEGLKLGAQKVLPARAPLGDQIFDTRRLTLSRVAHRLLNTIGRELFFPYSALGVVLRRDG